MRSSRWGKLQFRGLALALVGLASPAAAQLDLGPEQLVQSGGVDIAVPGYSTPTLSDWNNDGLPDLIIGEGSGALTPKVRVYLNTGSLGSPAFSGFSHAQSLGLDLTEPGGG